MRKVCKSFFLTGVIGLLGVVLTNGMARADTEVTNVQPNAVFQNGSIEIDATITCDNATDLLVFEAVQNQGRNTGIGVLEVSCGEQPLPDPLIIPIFDNLTFRSGPFNLFVKIYDSAGAFLKGQGFKLKGK